MAADPMLGLWWSPLTPDKQWPGNLFVDEDSSVRLELLTLEPSTSTPNFDLLLGISDGRRYSAVDLLNLSFGMRMGTAFTAPLKFDVGSLLRDIHLRSSREKFERFSFSVEGLQDWAGLTGLRSEWMADASHFDFERTFYQTNPTPKDIEIDGLKFHFFGTRKIPSEKWSISVTEDTQVHVTANEPKTISSWMREVVHPLQRLIQIGVKTGGNLQRLAVSHKLSDTGGGGQNPDWFNVVCQTEQLDFSPRYLRFNQPMFTISEFENDPSRLSKWLEIDRKLRLALVAMLQSENRGKTPDYTLFVHARLIERLIDDYDTVYLCDKATANRIATFAAEQVEDKYKDKILQKIKSQIRADLRVPLVKCFEKWLVHFEGWNPTAEELDWIAGKVITTRNHFAHLDTSAEWKRIQPGAFGVFVDLLKTVIDFEICNALGIDSMTIAERLRDTHQWRNGNMVHQVWLEEQFSAQDS